MNQATKKILVIEDNDNIRENIEELLALDGYNVIAAANGKKGVELAITELPDLILCDILMPILDGYGVLYVLGKNHVTSSIPFIFLTAKSEDTDILKGIAMGADEFILKPYDEDALLKIVKKRLNRSTLLKGSYSRDEIGIRQFITDAKEYVNLDIDPDEVTGRNFGAGHILFAEGEKPANAYFLVEGKGQSFLLNDKGNKFITNTHESGSFLGYLTIIEEANHRDSAEITEDSILLLIPENMVSQLVTYDNLVAQQFIRLLVENDPGHQEKVMKLSYNMLRKKVAHCILKVKSKKEPVRSEPVETTLLRAVKTSKENLMRILGDFRSENLIDLKEGEIVVLQERKLASSF